MAAPAITTSPTEEQPPQITFSPEAYVQLQVLAAAKGMTVPEYIRAAISLTQWLDEALADGGTVLARYAHRSWTVLRAPTR